MMPEVNAFFYIPNNHLKNLDTILPTIYQKKITDKCAPANIMGNEKYSEHQSRKVALQVRNIISTADD